MRVKHNVLQNGRLGVDSALDLPATATSDMPSRCRVLLYKASYRQTVADGALEGWNLLFYGKSASLNGHATGNAKVLLKTSRRLRQQST